MGRTAKTHYKGLDSKISIKGRGRTLCGIFVARKQLVTTARDVRHLRAPRG